MQLLVSLFLLLSVWPAVAQESSSKSKPHGKPAAPAARETAETIYRNPDFGFTYKIPYAWIDRTKPMQDETADPSTSKLLLAVFERPPEVTGDTVNSAVVITAESAPYPGLKESAADYMGPLTELTHQQRLQQTADLTIPVGRDSCARTSPVSRDRFHAPVLARRPSQAL
jgi:hypothetical protein